VILVLLLLCYWYCAATAALQGTGAPASAAIGASVAPYRSVNPDLAVGSTAAATADVAAAGLSTTSAVHSAFSLL
jgi:pheromone shutdown protein TraB